MDDLKAGLFVKDLDLFIRHSYQWLFTREIPIQLSIFPFKLCLHWHFFSSAIFCCLLPINLIKVCWWTALLIEIFALVLFSLHLLSVVFVHLIDVADFRPHASLNILYMFLFPLLSGRCELCFLSASLTILVGTKVRVFIGCHSAVLSLTRVVRISDFIVKWGRGLAAIVLSLASRWLFKHGLGPASILKHLFLLMLLKIIEGWRPSRVGLQWGYRSWPWSPIIDFFPLPTHIVVVQVISFLLGVLKDRVSMFVFDCLLAFRHHISVDDWHLRVTSSIRWISCQVLIDDILFTELSVSVII